MCALNRPIHIMYLFHDKIIGVFGMLYPSLLQAFFIILHPDNDAESSAYLYTGAKLNLRDRILGELGEKGSLLLCPAKEARAS